MNMRLSFPWIYVIEVLLWLPLLGAFFALASFLAAQPAIELLAAGKPIPTGWEAAVKNHGMYYEWYLISTHVLLFGITVAVFIGAAIGMFVVRRTEKLLLEHGDPQVTKWHVPANFAVMAIVAGLGYLFLFKVFL